MTMSRRMGICLGIALLSALIAPAVFAAPDHFLIGTWTGTGRGLDAEGGYFDIPVSMTVLEVRDNLFRGTMSVTPPGGSLETVLFAGVLVMPERKIHISLVTGDEGEHETYTLIEGQVTGRVLKCIWRNVNGRQCGTMKLRKGAAA